MMGAMIKEGFEKRGVSSGGMYRSIADITKLYAMLDTIKKK